MEEEIPDEHPTLAWMAVYAALLLNRCEKNGEGGLGQGRPQGLRALQKARRPSSAASSSARRCCLFLRYLCGGQLAKLNSMWHHPRSSIRGGGDGCRQFVQRPSPEDSSTKWVFEEGGAKCASRRRRWNGCGRPKKRCNRAGYSECYRRCTYSPTPGAVRNDWIQLWRAVLKDNKFVRDLFIPRCENCCLALFGSLPIRISSCCFGAENFLEAATTHRKRFGRTMLRRHHLARTERTGWTYGRSKPTRPW